MLTAGRNLPALRYSMPDLPAVYAVQSILLGFQHLFGRIAAVSQCTSQALTQPLQLLMIRLTAYCCEPEVSMQSTGTRE